MKAMVLRSKIPASNKGSGESGCPGRFEIDLFGQKVSVCATFWSVLTICALIGLPMFGLVALERISPGIVKDFYYGAYGKIGKEWETPSAGATIYSFWTPGGNSYKESITGLCERESIACTDNPQIEKLLAQVENLDWYDVDDEKLRTFGRELKKTLGLGGYSRYPVTGAGEKPEKSGWQWQVVVPDGNDFDLTKFQNLYNETFGLPKSNRTTITTQILGPPPKRK